MKRGLLTLMVASIVAGGCASTDEGGGNDTTSLRRTIARLPVADVDVAEPAVPTHKEILDAYARVEGRLDARTNQAVGRRMAELSMEAGEDADARGDRQPYEAAIRRYEALLATDPGEGREEITYQLARAYDLAGNTASSLRYLDSLLSGHPASGHATEAYFRRAEIHFSGSRYDQAASDYEMVVAAGDETPFYRNALYMLGWSEFKLSSLDAALSHFYALIGTLGDEGRELSRAESELLDDTLRVTVLALGYEEGPRTLADSMAVLGNPPWQHRVYARLAEDYVTKERYTDAVATWKEFVQRNPLDVHAPAAQQEVIRILAGADFPTDAEKGKEDFVALFGIASPFWAQHEGEVRARYAPVLKEYLGTLATNSHAAVQKLAKSNKATNEDYLAAAHWYEELLQTFPDSEDASRRLYLLGDLYTDAGDHQRAVTTYQRLEADYPDAPEAADAGYAVILGLDRIRQGQQGESAELARRLQIDAQMAFAMNHRDDPRAVAVQAAAASSLYELQDYALASDVAVNLLTTWPQADRPIRESALAIVGHARFEAGDYAGAEQSYRELLAIARDKELRARTNESLLAAVYKQGEQAEDGEDAAAAREHYLRLAEIDPNSETAIRGAFDAVALMEKQGDTRGAASLLSELRSRYPKHPLMEDAGIRLAGMYEKSGDGLAAAGELKRLAESSVDAEVRRQSTYRAAELFLAGGEIVAATKEFAVYAKSYQLPYEQRFEAMHQLETLYGQLNNASAQKQWRQEMVRTWTRNKASNTPRTTTLTAMADLALSLENRQAFDAIAIKAPLAKSLKAKQAALRKAVDGFERVAGYQVQDVLTATTFQIADLYTALARSIMASERPRNLSATELEEYDLLLEEQAYPFEEKAISLHELNMQRSWQGVYDEWVRKSFDELGRLMPARFDKKEIEVAYVEAIN
ncbi:MAG: tetratricopeptide repeat protein [Pseudomonadales bacterium]|nr:tetratricopeptide repeat protein [Pseudomonadales bacterium]